MISLILHAEILNPIRPLLRIQPNLAVSIFLDHPVPCIGFLAEVLTEFFPFYYIKGEAVGEENGCRFNEANWCHFKPLETAQSNWQIKGARDLGNNEGLPQTSFDENENSK